MCVVPTLITKDAQTQKHAAETNAKEAALQRGIAEKNSAVALRTARESKTRELAAFSTESLIDDLDDPSGHAGGERHASIWATSCGRCAKSTTSGDLVFLRYI
jgi:hypothetical protein